MLQHKRLWIITLIAAALVLAACGGDDDKDEGKTGEAAWTAGVATLQVTEGSAALAPGGDDSAAQTVLPDQSAEVRAGDRITMSADSEAVLTFFTGVQTHLSPGTVLEVQAIESSNESFKVEMNALVGQTFSVVDRVLDAESRHVVNTPAAAISVRGTQYAVFVRPNTLTQVVSFEGTVAVSAQDQSTDVPCGYGLAVQPDGTIGELKVWGFANVQIVTPDDELAALPVTFTKLDNGQTFRYRAGVTMSLPLGEFDMVVDSPGPVRVGGIVFPPETTPEDMRLIEVQLSAIVLNVVDEAGNPVADAGHLIVRLQQDDLSGQTTTAPGSPILVGPGTWQLEVALDSAPDQVQTLEVTVPEGEQVSAEIALDAFDAAGRGEK
ncbi:MAG: hypothetical protein JW910_20445 [Anaerolineae bacterium]|nr:hypothetical protein [Anaerolineae bacterium]